MANVPEHIAIIMDGNGRWAKKRGMPRTAGHTAGAKATRATVENCARAGVKHLTLFAFSSENWKRPPAEVRLLMQLFDSTLLREVDNLDKNNIRLRFIGERSLIPPKLQKLMSAGEAQTANNQRMTLNIAVSYGGRWDVLTAAKCLAEQINSGQLAPADVTEEHLGAHMQLGDSPDPDLFIRTGGDHRISNFLLWNLAYTELFFSDVLWPDFDLQELERAMANFGDRERRFGLTGEQVQKK